MTDEQRALVPTEEKTIVFYDDELTAVMLAGGEIYAPVRRLCDNLGLSWAGQRERINRDKVLADALKTVRVTRTVKEGGRGGGPIDTLCLPLDLVPGWLFGIQTSRVKEEIRPKLIRYRRECFRVLWDAFKADVLPQLDPALSTTQLAAEMSPAEQALAQVEALYHLAKQQVAIERWLAQHDNRLDAVEDVALAAHERLDEAGRVVRAIQLRVYGPGQVVSESQAAEMAELVKGIAQALTREDPSKNHYQGVWGELHRRYGVTTYRRVPADRFADVIAWLESWLESSGKENDTQ
jgi:hypothetical protein